MECSRSLDRSEAIHRYTLISMAIAEAAALDNEIIDCIVCEVLRLGVQVISLTRTRLSFQQLHPEIGDLQLLLNFGTIGVLGIIWRRQCSENNLPRERKHHMCIGLCANLELLAQCSLGLIYTFSYLRVIRYQGGVLDLDHTWG